jgi:hypothetical protein
VKYNTAIGTLRLMELEFFIKPDMQNLAGLAITTKYFYQYFTETY